ncbi:hypothetical protein Hanom_Chr09g00773191 [Helianthus anomalus]
MLVGVKNGIGIREVVWIFHMESSNQHNDNNGIPMSIEIEQLLAEVEPPNINSDWLELGFVVAGWLELGSWNTLALRLLFAV